MYILFRNLPTVRVLIFGRYRCNKFGNENEQRQVLFENKNQKKKSYITFTRNSSQVQTPNWRSDYSRRLIIYQ